MSRTAEIKVTVDLDGDNVPVKIEWEATEANNDGPMPCQSVMLSLWDSDKKTAAAIDLWTKDTTVADMNLHFYQMFHRLGESYLRATKNAEVADQIHEFGDGFGRTLGLR